MIAALTMMCAVQGAACQYPDARAIAGAIDAATEDDGLRAQLVVSAWHESRFRVRPKPDAWDSRIGLAIGPWQEWSATTDTPLRVQASRWLWMVARGGYPALCGYGHAAARIAYARAREAAALLEIVGGK